ncbi:MAG: flagellar hook-basal body complex protein FliE [Aestuariivirga sp.]
MISPLSIGASLALSAFKPENLLALSKPAEQGGLKFANVLSEGEAAAIKGITGEMPLQQAVEKVLEAERALQTAISIRDKVVGAYLEISRMQI